MFARLLGLGTISPSALHELIRAKRVAVVDVNSPQSWLKARVPGAINLDPTSYDANDLPADKASRIVFYCSNPLCRKAPKAARRAKTLGYSNAVVMSAGISGWVGANMPTESG
ncbi:rhodanese-like domain-containing protein [Massilia pinisoli]|uniref:Rhodanese-like domain-containing protein n=1 Tax=Massilia pinisoli TaxID=1772194 RepID=A0ABT1ZZB8_9BURK|nr:rhodanese-like domain-containing protein [Massilia pinisoli]MCS0585235.1 rhodanese-like domain-containing protein [Massilia pinisoli]